MSKFFRRYILALLILNILVLMGQVYPEGAPPFARLVNLIFLVLSLLFFTYLAVKKPKIK